MVYKRGLAMLLAVAMLLALAPFASAIEDPSLPEQAWETIPADFATAISGSELVDYGENSFRVNDDGTVDHTTYYVPTNFPVELIPYTCPPAFTTFMPTRCQTTSATTSKGNAWELTTRASSFTMAKNTSSDKT